MPLWVGVLAFMPALLWAGETTLPYQAQNQWVAPADNAKLQPLYRAAQGGTRTFRVVLPKSTPKTLSEKRLGVLISLLEKQGSHPVTLTEASGKTAPNTLTVSW